MPFDGSGNFSSAGPNFPAVALTVIESAKYNAVINDIGAGLSQCITRDGQTTILGDIPFSGFGLLNVGKFVKGGNAGQPVAGVTYDFSWNSVSTAGAFLNINRWQAAAGGTGFITAKSRGSLGAHTVLNNNDTIGAWFAFASDGTQFLQAGSIEFQVDGAPGTNDMPTRFVLSLTQDAGAAPVEMMRISQDKSVIFTGTVDVDGGLVSAGTSGSTIAFRHAFTNGVNVLGGGNSTTDGSNVLVFGSTHADAGDFRLRDGTTAKVGWDSSTATLTLAQSGDNVVINGENVSHPGLPCFLASNTVTDANQTGAGASVTVDFNNEIFDIGGNFAADTFTAPDTGKYLLTASVQISDLTTAMNNFLLNLSTSNNVFIYNDMRHIEAAADFTTFTVSAVCDMDAADTAAVLVQVSGGAGNTADISGSAVGPATYFSGVRIA